MVAAWFRFRKGDHIAHHRNSCSSDPDMNPRLCPSRGTIGVSFRLMFRTEGANYGNANSQSQTVMTDTMVAISTDEAATRRAAPYMLANM